VVEIDYDDENLNIIGDGLSVDIRTTSDTITIDSGNDLDLKAQDDIRFYADTDVNNYQWRMDSEGRFQLPGDGYIENPTASSGDGSANDTIKIVPDDDLQDTDQYLIVDPTGGEPGHIHIRAGGQQDNSNADLILGGERTNVSVSDTSGQVMIGTKGPDEVTYFHQNVEVQPDISMLLSGQLPAETRFVKINGVKYSIYNHPSNGFFYLQESDQTFVVLSDEGVQFEPGQVYEFGYDIQPQDKDWTFTTDGYIIGPDQGGLLALGMRNASGDLSLGSTSNISLSSDLDINVNASDSVILNGTLGEFLGSSDNADNQIATIGNLNGATAKHFGSVFSNQIQTGTTNSVQDFTFNNTDVVNGITFAANQAIVFSKAGTYNIAFSAQLYQTHSSATVNIWLKKNGFAESNTNTKVNIASSDPYNVAAWNWFVTVQPGDEIRLAWSSSSEHTVIQAESSATIGGVLHPSIPSVIVTVNEVS
jgi:plastocyanin